MTSGTISEYARQRIFDWCGTENYGENVYFLDGEQLENKERFAKYESDQEKRQHYTALHNEFVRNQSLLRIQIDSMVSGKAQFFQFRIPVLESELRRQPLYDGTHGLATILEDTWQRFSTYNQLNGKDAVPFRLEVLPNLPSMPDMASIKQNMIEKMRSLIGNLDGLIKYCREELHNLDDRYSLEATTIEPVSAE